MRKQMNIVLGTAILLAAGLALAHAEVNLPLGGGANGIEGLKLVPTSGVKATLSLAAAADGDKSAAKIAFKKDGEERRLIALVALPKGNPDGARAVSCRYKVTLASGKAPHLALVVYQTDGVSWYKVVGEAMPAGGTTPVREFTEGRIPVTAMNKTAFSEGEAKTVAWDKLGRVWLGIVLDSAAEGTIEFSEARFTDQAYRPTTPVRVTGDGAGTWGVGQDPAVVSKLTTPNEGPDDKPCLKVEFKFPIGMHMYMIPSTSVPATDLEGYTAIRFMYKATLPQGLIGSGLLVTLGERSGAQYTVDVNSMPPASAEWRSVTIPFEKFALAGWAKDDNNHFDTDQINNVQIGCHGSAQGNDGTGTIWLRDVEFVP